MRRGEQVCVADASEAANRDSGVVPAGPGGPRSEPGDAHRGRARLPVACALAALVAACAPRPPADASTVAPEIEGEVEPAEPAPPPVLQAHGQLVWLASEEEALSRGRAERRPVLVHFATEWCADCKRMVSETFGDPRVKSLAGRFVAVRIDATNDEDPEVDAALSKYSVVNVPTLILLDSSGHEQRRFTEFVRPDTLLAEIEHVR